MTSEDTGPVSDIRLDFTRHSLKRLRERIGLSFSELGKLCGNCFEIERSHANGKAAWRIVVPFGFSLTTWRMVVPFRLSLIGTLDGGGLFVVVTIVKTDLSDVGDNFGKSFRRVGTARVSAIQFPWGPRWLSRKRGHQEVKDGNRSE